MSDGKVVLGLDGVLKRCRQRGAILTDDHVVLTPKPDGFYHAPGYFDKDRVLSDAMSLNAIGSDITARFWTDDIDCVAGPTTGAVGLAAAVAMRMYIQLGWAIDWVYAEEATKEEVYYTTCTINDAPTVKVNVPIKNKRVVKRCFPPFVKGKRILVVEDVFSSGGSAKATIDAVNEVGGNIIGVAVICNRGGITAEKLGVPRLEVLYDIPMVMHREEECPLCAANIPINMQVGHGKAFYQRHPDSKVPKQEIPA